MQKSGLRRLPVIDEEGRLVGIFTLTTLLKRRETFRDEDLGISESQLLELSYGDL
jgi:CBS domain-containing protein